MVKHVQSVLSWRRLTDGSRVSVICADDLSAVLQQLAFIARVVNARQHLSQALL